MAIFLAIAGSLLGLSIILRIVRFALTLVLIAVIVDLLTGHGAGTAAQLTHLL